MPESSCAIRETFDIGVLVTSRICNILWCHRVVVSTTAQLHSTKPELKFRAGSNPACSLLEIQDGENL